MRPPKKILLLSEDAPLAFSMNIQTWLRVHRVETVTEAVKYLTETYPVAAVVVDRSTGKFGDVGLIWGFLSGSGVPLLVLSADPNDDALGDVRITPKFGVGGMSEFMERLRMISSRKRGPQKKPLWSFLYANHRGVDATKRSPESAASAQ